MTPEDLIPEHVDDPATEQQTLTLDEVRQIIADERRENGPWFSPSPTPKPIAHTPSPTDPPSFEDEARARAADALERQEQRTHDVKAARALLDEEWEPYGFDSSKLSDSEALAEAGIVLTDEKRRQLEAEARERELRSNPAALERALNERAAHDLAANWWSLHPNERQRTSRDLGLDPTAVETAAKNDPRFRDLF